MEPRTRTSERGGTSNHRVVIRLAQYKAEGVFHPVWADVMQDPPIATDTICSCPYTQDTTQARNFQAYSSRSPLPICKRGLETLIMMERERGTGS